MPEEILAFQAPKRGILTKLTDAGPRPAHTPYAKPPRRADGTVTETGTIMHACGEDRRWVTGTARRRTAAGARRRGVAVTDGNSRGRKDGGMVAAKR